MVRIAIVEDEDKFAEVICDYLKKYEKEEREEFEIIRFRDGYEIVDGYPDGIDIILMDIEMGLMNGMEAAERIRETDEQVTIIFLTNMAKYALRGYKVNALDYVLKPIEYTPFSQILKKALRILDHVRDQYITINMRDGIRKIRTPDISWIESHGHRLTFHTNCGDWETTVYSMKEVEEKLEPNGFKRCSSGILINLKHVTRVLNGYVEVGGESLPVSRGRKNDFMTALVRYMTQ